MLFVYAQLPLILIHHTGSFCNYNKCYNSIFSFQWPFIPKKREKLWQYIKDIHFIANVGGRVVSIFGVARAIEIVKQTSLWSMKQKSPVETWSMVTRLLPFLSTMDCLWKRNWIESILCYTYKTITVIMLICLLVTVCV